MLKRKYLLIVIALVVALATLAPIIPPPPPPEPADCSPGFWKNHTEYWVGYDPGDQYNAEMTLLDALQGGKDTRVSRFVVADWLNATNPDAPCD